MSFSLLKKLHENKGFWSSHPIRIFFERYLRLMPLYLFMIFFLWQFVNTLGGDGPRFYQFEEKHSCRETWFFHLLMVNNMVPWRENDFCLSDSWYLANDFWFMIFALMLIDHYYKHKKVFYGLLLVFCIFCFAIQTV